MSRVFFLLFGAIGALSPFLSIYYHRLGLSGKETSLLMSVMPVLLLISQPIFGPLTDKSGHRGRMLGALLVVVAATGAAVAIGTSFWTLLPLIAIWSFFSGPLVPIADSIALGEVAKTGVSYPRIRLWGSVGFLIVTTIAGMLYKWIDLRWAFVIYGLLNLVAWRYSRSLPAEGVTQQKPVWPELRRLVTNPYLIIFLLLCAIMQTTQAAHSVFFSRHIEVVGGTAGTAGLAWALAALTEVPVWWVLGRVTKRTGPLPLMAVAGLVFALRWYLYSIATDPAMLVGLQLMQAFSFAIFMPTAVHVIGEFTPPELRTTGQALLMLVNGGLATVIGTLGAGYLVDLHGTAGLYRTVSSVALIGGVGFILLILARALRGGAHPKEAEPNG